MAKWKKREENVPLTRRQKFHLLLESILGSKNVYFQPPASVKMEYPCIVYHKEKPDIQHADNRVYARRQRYSVIHISRNPDDITPDLIVDLIPLCDVDRYYTADNLHHVVFDIYF